MKINILEIIAFLSIYIYNSFLIKSYDGIVNFKFDKIKINLVIPIILSIISVYMIKNEIFLLNAYIFSFLLYIVIFKFVFDESIGTVCILGIYQIFQITITQDIILGLIAMILRKGMSNIIQSYSIYLISFSLTRIIMVISIKKFNNEFYKKKLKKLLVYRKKLTLNIISIISLTIVLLVSDYIYYYYGYKKIYELIMVISRIFIYICFYCNVFMGIKTIQWMEEEVFYKTNLLNIEYNKNLNKKIDEYSNLFRMHNHDFSSILTNINDCIDIGNIKKAKKIIFDFNNKIKKVITYTKKFSNDSLINTILNRLYEESIANDIYFDSDCYIPKNISIKEIDLINIFNNLSSNALEACLKQEKCEKKWIEFKSYVKENNFIIYQSNSFDGKINIKNDRLRTTKKNKKLHGIGVESIKHIVNEANGMELIKIDSINKEFKFLIKIPMSNKSTKF